MITTLFSGWMLSGSSIVVLELIQQYKCIELTELYILVKQKKNMSYPILILCLDWLYLLNAAIINKKGEVCLCS